MDYAQTTRLQKLSTEEFYLLDKHLINTVTYEFIISGSTANVYKVCIYGSNNTIFCNCPDGKNYCRKLNVICKHSCFVLFRILKCFTTHQTNSFFDSLVFSGEDMEKIKKRFAELNLGVGSDYINGELLAKYKGEPAVGTATTTGEKLEEDLLGQFKAVKVADSDDQCVICFEEFSKTVANVECPTCHNLIHQKCMDKWISMGRINCVYCRSDVWKKYVDLQKPKTEVKTGRAKKKMPKSTGEYLNLN